MGNRKRRVARRGRQWMLQNEGVSRREARRMVFGPTRREATSHPTRRSHLAERVGINAAAKRWRRLQQVASSIAVAEASW